MKKALLAAIVLLTSMLGAIPAHATPTAQACGSITKEWSGIIDSPYAFDSHRWVNLRRAWRVTLCNGSPTSVQTYLAVTCEYDGQPHACSFWWTMNAWDNDTHYEDRMNVNNDTGTDGFASTYGPSRSVTRCHTYKLLASISDVGIAGARFPNVVIGSAHTTFNPCV